MSFEATKVLRVPTVYLRLILAYVGNSKESRSELLSGSGISLKELSTLNGFVSVESYRALLRNVLIYSEDPLLMLKAGVGIPLTAHGAVTQACISSRNLLTSFRIASKYARLRGEFIYMDVIEQKEYTKFVIGVNPVLGTEENAALDFILGTIASSIAVAKLVSINPVTLRLSRTESLDTSWLEENFGCDIVFGCKQNELIFRTDDLYIDLPSYDKTVFDSAESLCRDMMSSFSSTQNTVSIVEGIFESNLGILCFIDKVADHIGVSSRTLQRRLNNEGTTFQQVSDRWLKAKAQKYLLVDKLNVKNTAYYLGYSDESNFRRAFKRWFGCSPAEFLLTKN